MKLPSGIKTYLHSLVGIAVAMIVIFATLSFLQNRGPAFVQGPAGQLGSLVGGNAFHF